MKSLSNQLSSLKTSFNTRLNCRTRKRSLASISAYQSLEKRNLLTAFTVTTIEDSLAADGLVSLREAIRAANTNSAFVDAPAGDVNGDTIAFAPGLLNQTISLDLNGLISSNPGVVNDLPTILGEIEISDDLQIVGNIAIDAQRKSKIFEIVTSENVVLSGLTFVNGVAGRGLLSERRGGAVEVFNGNLVVSNATFLSSNAADFIRVDGDLNEGGALYSVNSNVRIGRTTFSDNVATVGGAISAHDSNIQLFKTTFNDNISEFGGGGAIFSRGGRLSVVDSNFQNNTASSGGAIDSEGELFVSQATFTNNNAIGETNGGGAILSGGDGTRKFIRDSDFIGNRARVSGGGFSLQRNSTAFVNNTRFEGNVAGDGNDGSTNLSAHGGGIYNVGQLFVTGGVIESNSALNGGGGVGAEDGLVRLNGVTVQGNRAGSFGGGVSGVATDITLIQTVFSSNRVNNEMVPAGTLTTTDIRVGGAVFASGQEASGAGDYSVFIKESDFTSNFAGHGGGAIAAEGVKLRIVDSNFNDNVVYTIVAPVLASGETFSGGGGAILHRSENGLGRRFIMARNSFSRNNISFGGQARDFGSRLTFLGGAVSTIDSDAIVLGSNFLANTSDGSGGALAQTGSSTLRLVDNTFTNNRAGNNQIPATASSVSFGSPDSPNGLGGAFYSDNSEATSAFPIQIFGGVFSGNSALKSGGAIFATSTDPQARLFVRANSAGEGVSFINNRAFAEDGGAFAGNGVSMNARDAFFARNAARNGGAVFVEGGGELRIVFSDFRRNAARINGGAVNFADTEFVNFQNAFFNNTAVNGPDFFEQN